MCMWYRHAGLQGRILIRVLTGLPLSVATGLRLSLQAIIMSSLVIVYRCLPNHGRSWTVPVSRKYCIIFIRFYVDFPVDIMIYIWIWLAYLADIIMHLNDIKGVIGHQITNNPWPKVKGQTMNYKTLHRKQKIELH